MKRRRIHAHRRNSTVPTQLHTKLDRLIGANIKRLRIARELTQGKLGEYLGVTFQQIQKYESGKNSISAASLAVLAVALKCRMEEFFALPHRANDRFAIERFGFDQITPAKR